MFGIWEKKSARGALTGLECSSALGHGSPPQELPNRIQGVQSVRRDQGYLMADTRIPPSYPHSTSSRQLFSAAVYMIPELALLAEGQAPWGLALSDFALDGLKLLLGDPFRFPLFLGHSDSSASQSGQEAFSRSSTKQGCG